MTQYMVLNKKYSKITVLLLLLLTAAGNAMAQGGVVVGGNVYGGGNLADVKVNTTVNMGGGRVEGNVYGGGNLADVGTHADQNPVSVGNYIWKDQDGNAITANTAANKLTGFSQVTITGGTIGVDSPAEPKEHGNVYGGGKGAAITFECEKAMVYRTNVSINTGGTVKGNVYGGGEVSRVEENTVVTIGTASGTDEPTIEGSVFAAGAGLETHGYSALVRGTSTVTVQGKAKVLKNVYGGGELASVGRYKVKTKANDTESDVPATLPYGMPARLIEGGTSTVMIQDNAAIGTDNVATTGHVYGAGQGLEPTWTYTEYTQDDPYTTRITNSKRMVIYGSSIDHPDGKRYSEWDYYEDEDHNVDNRYVWEYFTTKAAYLQFVETLALSAETDVTITGSATVKGSAFGGSESGFVYHDTDVKIQGGTINGDAFGGGRGLESFAEAGRVRGNTKLTMSGSASVLGNVYGGGNLGDVGTIFKEDKDKDGNLSYNYFWRNSDANGNVNDTNTDHSNTDENNKITGTNKNTGICTVTINGGTIGVDSPADATKQGNVFGASRGTGITWWCEKAMVFATNVSITAGTVKGNVYGGGQIGRVGDDAKVTIGTADASGDDANPIITGSVFGAGAGLYTHGYSALLRGNAEVIVQGIAQVGGSVYGGGETSSVGRFKVVGGLPTEPDGGGTCKVTVKDNAIIGASGTTNYNHNVYGACKGVTPAYNNTKNDPNRSKSMQTYENRPKYADGTEKSEDDYWNYYTDDEGHTDNRFVWVYYETKNDYLNFLHTLALTSHVDLEIGGSSSVYGSVYGGGQRGITLGHVDVDITGGTIYQDVYGGGALADTNKGNEKGSKYDVATVTVDETDVTGMYELSEGAYVLTEDTKAEYGKTYYTKAAQSTINTTKVDLTGGHIKGDAYGGGLGQKDGFNGKTEDIPAVVWGDIAVTLNGTKFDINYDTTTDPETDNEGNIVKDNGGNTVYVKVVKSGRVFGCNNLLGSPQGDVTVTVWKTVAGNTERTSSQVRTSNKAIMDNHPGDYESVNEYVTPTYEVAAVYGGGNLAPYEATGKKAHVIIYGCDDTSIQTVYGGGNAAPVPETDVDIHSCYEIGSVFGGGNGKDKYKNDAGWQINPGANVGTEIQPGNANTMIYGGTVHKAYGGSNEKGTIYGDVTIDVVDNGLEQGDYGYCKLDVGQLVGAGKNADVNGNLKIIMGCKPNVTIPLVFGGADNANVNGDVELTVTSGKFGNIVGGNNNGGRIKGHIILNIEETTCIPLKIDNLYLCGYNALYSQYGYYVKTKSDDPNATLIGAPSETPDLNPTNGKLQLIPRESANDSHLPIDTYSYTYNAETGEAGATWTVLPITGDNKFEGYASPVLNVISCTKIDKVFGGGYGATATVYGNPTVNINMIPGKYTSSITREGTASGHALGAVGNVYGGGSEAKVCGNTTVNIGTKTTVPVYIFDDTSGEYELQYDNGTPATKTENVEGAYITGNVYGGGKLADVTGNTYVNVCAEQVAVLDVNSQPTGEYTYNIVNITGTNYEGVTIGGNVYGGGEGYAKMEEGTAGEAFLCAKAMIGVDGEGIEDKDNNGVADHPEGGTSVVIGNGTVTGNVYGGGQVGRVEKNTKVTIGIGDGGGGENPSAPVIQGNVFGAGAGVSTHGYSALVRGTSTVLVEGDAKVLGSVYGGGEKASVGRYIVGNDGLPQALNNALAPTSGYCYVTIRGYAEIGPDDMKMYHTDANGDLIENNAPDDAGHVFGACQGVMPYQDLADNVKPKHMDGIRQNDESWVDHLKEYTAYGSLDADAEDADYSKFIKSMALATQTLVTIEGNPFIKGSVYGGSENGYVQKNTHVVISSGQIGNGYVQMNDNGTYLNKLSTPLTPLAVNRRYTDEEWTAGHLIMGTNDRQALKDLVSPGGNPTYYTTSLPECASWPYGQAANEVDRYAPYDREANKTGYLGQYANGESTKGGRYVGDDGHTFYGNVFGGGSGYYPYRPGKWFKDAGAVYGNTYVTIKGGHILTNIYGGNEMTDVGKYADDDYLNLTSGGSCYVTMIGGTLGVPRTLKQIDVHPVTCYLFGAGKGDQRVFFNKSTNVGNVFVHISDDARIYGSVFGGGEDGHVMKNVTMNIGGSTLPDVYSSTSTDDVLKALNLTATGTKPVTTSEGTITYPYIGTWGTSYVEGNVFGGGRGFGADAYTAGNVAGTVTMNIYGGTMLGSIYGGGRLGSVGYGLFNEGVTGYGEMQEDNTMESYGGAINPLDNFPRGYVYMTIGDDDGNGPTIGNAHEYKFPSASNGPMTTGETPAPTLPADISTWTPEDWTTWKEYNHVPKTEYDTTNGRLTHTKGGNVFTGGMGRLHQLNGTSYISAIDWWKLGNVKSTTLTIKGGTIKSNVYGGGELGQVVGNHTTKNAANQDINASTEITIGSNTTIPTIGTPIDDGSTVQYTFGSVFGGGYGSLVEKIEVQRGTSPITSYPKYIAGLVKEDTKIDMQGGAVKASIYGGGEMASVGESTTSGETTTVTGSTHVIVSGGTIGIAPTGSGNNIKYYGGAKMGNVYGGGSGHGNTVRSGRILKNTNVTISGGTVYHNVYGGGAYGTVGDFKYTEDTNNYNKVIGVERLLTSGTGVATVTITGGTIGYDGKENGMVFGSSRGDINAPGARDDHAAWVYDTHVTIGTSGSQTGPQINGTVYGSGENGHVFNDTEVNVYSGTIGIASGMPVTSNGKTYNGAEYPYRGNVYGGGCGTDMYYSNHDLETHDGGGDMYNSLAGIVYGNATVNITGGRVVRNVYGAGAMGSVTGRAVTTTANNVTTTTYIGGTTTINISGGTVGVDGNNGDGNVYGAARGNATTTQTDVALVKNTSVNISANAKIKGSVYGGGETGDVQGNTEVNVCAVKQTSGEDVTYVVTSGTPTIGGNVYGGGEGAANSFTCWKAMVGVEGDGVTGSGTTESPYNLQDGGTTVRIYNGKVGTLVGEEGSQTLKENTGNVYGGGKIARVERNTSVEIGAATGATAPLIYGNVFAAGAGLETHGYSALVRGTSTVTVQGSAQVWKNVFGGGEKASVGRYKVKTPANSGDKDVPATLPLGMPARLLAGGTSTVNIQGSAEIGIDSDANTGHVYGAGQGVGPSWTYTEYTSNDTPYSTRIKNSKRMVNYTSSTAHPVGKQYKEWDYYIDENGREDQNYVWEYFPTESAYLQFIESLAISAATDVTIGGGTVKGSVFGGSESGFVYHNTDVKIQGGTVNGDAFGGGRGLKSFAEAGRVGWNTNLAISGDGAVKGNVYGGGNLGDVGTINKSDQTNHNYVWKNTDSNGNNMDPDNNNTAENNSITGTNKNTGICTVTISGGIIGVDNPADATKQGNVFGASHGSDKTYWCEKATVFATNVTITDGIVKGNVYGGGEIGRVEDDTKVTIGTGLTGDESGDDNHPTITGNVFGAGAGEETHGYSALVRGNCITTVQGTAKVGKNVYGGGEKATAGKYWISKFVPEPGNPAPEGMPDGMPYKTRGGGKCYVTVKDNAQIGPNGGATEFDGHLFGAGKGVTPAYYYDPANTGTKENWSKRMMTYNASTHVSGEGGGEGTTWDYYPEDRRFVWEYFTTEAKYLEFLQTLALATETHVTVQGNATVMGTVYGGSDSGFVQDDTEVNILGQSKIGKDDAHSYSNIFGGGKGHETFHEAGMVKGNTTVNAFGGEIYGSVYGGGAKSKVVGSTNVNIGEPAK